MKFLNFQSENGNVRIEGDEALLSVKRSGCEPERAFFTADADFIEGEKIVLSYSLIGLYRGKSYRAPFLYLTDGAGNITPLIARDDLNTDGRRYTVCANIPGGSYRSLCIELEVDRAKLCELRVHSLYTVFPSESGQAFSHFSADRRKNIFPIDISQSLNGRFSLFDNDVTIGGIDIEKEEITPHGIPFFLKCDGNNAIIPEPPPKENNEIIDNFGVKSRRRICRPVSRDSKDKIKIGKKVSEIYFILGMRGERYQRFTFATKGNILGKYGKEVTEPLRVEDVEGFFVEIIYADGKRDKAFPKNLTENRFSVSGDCSVYAVACDYSEVEAVVLHNKKLDTDFAILAVSANVGEQRYYQELLIPEKAKKPEREAHTERSIVLLDKIMKIRCGAVYAELSLDGELSLKELKSDFAEGLLASSESLISFKYEGAQEICLPTVISAAVTETRADILLESGAFSFIISLGIEEQNRITADLKVNNDSKFDERIGVFFPVIDRITARSDSDLYYFVPKYQNLLSNETAVVCEESSPSFPMQFLSVFSESEGAGIGLLTREREPKVRIYHLEKKNREVSLSVEYPEMYGKLRAGERFSASPTVIEARNGDWHATFESYREWLATWYKPYKSQNKQWYRECFWLLAEITDFFETVEHVRFPIWHEHGENPKFNFLDILKEQKSISGDYPDILHMWHWTVRYDAEGKKRVKWGNWGGEDYELYGGLERFRAALDEFQKKTGVYSSIYMHPTLFAESYPDFKKFEHLKVVNEEGKNIQLADSFRMCHANKDWSRYALDKYPKVYKELGVPILYVDEFSLRIENRCYAEGHGHEVPSNLLKTDLEFISRLKDTVPEELVLYGEYAAVDMNARYIDCNISYSILDSIVDMIERSWRAADGGENMGRVMYDAYRFAFPKIVQLVLPMALRNLSWQPHKFIFWNGEAEYDSFWDLLESEGNDFTIKAYRIKKKYADCFSTDVPEMMIETLSPAICINKFPGKGRTIYTVYNRAYRTYRGEIIKIHYTEGDTYYDAWGDREISACISGEYAYISLDIDAQSVGCIAVNHKKIQ